jgi:hypothetical protein
MVRNMGGIGDVAKFTNNLNLTARKDYPPPAISSAVHE